MPLVEEDAVDDSLDGLIESSVVEDDVGGFATQLEGEPLAGPRHRALNLLAHLRRPREGDLVDARGLDEEAPGLAGARDDVDHAGGQIRLATDVREGECRERGRLCGLEHDGVAARQCGGDLPREHEQGEVPRDDLASDPVGLLAVAGVGELVRPARVVEEVRGDQRDVDVAGLANRLAVVEGLEHGEFAGALLDDARDAVEVLRALATGHLGPRVLVRRTRRLDRALDICGTSVGDLAQDLFGRGVDGLEGGAVDGLDEIPVDEEPVVGGDVHHGPGFGCGGVVEGHRTPSRSSRSRDRSSGRCACAGAAGAGH